LHVSRRSLAKRGEFLDQEAGWIAAGEERGGREEVIESRFDK